MMKQMNGNISDQDERGLLPYPVIIAATKGDPEAMKIVVQHYEDYIASLSVRKLRDESGNTHITELTRIYATDYVQGLCEPFLISRSDYKCACAYPFPQAQNIRPLTFFDKESDAR